MVNLATNQANGNSSAVIWNGGAGTWAVKGTFGGATAKLQWTPDNGTTWLDYSGASVTAAGYAHFDLPECQIRLNVAGGGGTESLTALVGTRFLKQARI